MAQALAAGEDRLEAALALDNLGDVTLGFVLRSVSDKDPASQVQEATSEAAQLFESEAYPITQHSK